MLIRNGMLKLLQDLVSVIQSTKCSNIFEHIQINVFFLHNEGVHCGKNKTKLGELMQ